jgi:hypothetical protein
MASSSAAAKPAIYLVLFEWATVDEIEDPVTGMPLERTHFFETYTRVLETLDGQDPTSHALHWFERSPVNRASLRFRTDDLREEWLDAAIDMECVPPLQAICEGETRAEKHRRMMAASSSTGASTSISATTGTAPQPPRTAQPAQPGRAPRSAPKARANIRGAIAALEQRLASTTDASLRATLAVKLQRARAVLAAVR